MEEKRVLVKDLLRMQNDVEILQGAFNHEFLNCNTNTKTIKNGETFFAIDKGNDYIKDALKNGATCCVVEKNIEEELLKEYSEVTFIKVRSTLETLQNLAKYKRSLYDIPVIAITGSVGKTSTKDIVASVIAEQYNVLKTEGNFNNHIGLPLTILKLKNHDALVVEMGMNHFHEIELLSKIAKPSIAIITNIGTSHIGNLGSQRNILKAKLEILEGLQENGTLIINKDNELLKNWYEKENKNDKFKVITYSIYEHSDVKAESLNISAEKTEYTVKSEKVSGNISVPIYGEPFVYNSLAAIAVANCLNITYENVKNAINKIELTKKRMEVEEINGVKYINDAYNASYESMKYAIKYLNDSVGTRKIAVLGDMFELGEYTEELHKKVAKEIDNFEIDVLITAGEYSKFIDKEVKRVQQKIHLQNKEQVVEEIKKIRKSGDVILIKASNGMKFFEIIEDIKSD